MTTYQRRIGGWCMIAYIYNTSGDQFARDVHGEDAHPSYLNEYAELFAQSPAGAIGKLDDAHFCKLMDIAEQRHAIAACAREIIPPSDTDPTIVDKAIDSLGQASHVIAARAERCKPVDESARPTPVGIPPDMVVKDERVPVLFEKELTAEVEKSYRIERDGTHHVAWLAGAECLCEGKKLSGQRMESPHFPDVDWWAGRLSKGQLLTAVGLVVTSVGTGTGLTVEDATKP